MSLCREDIGAKRFLVALEGHDKDQVEGFHRELTQTVTDILSTAEERHTGRPSSERFDDLEAEAATIAGLARVRDELAWGHQKGRYVAVYDGLLGANSR